MWGRRPQPGARARPGAARAFSFPHYTPCRRKEKAASQKVRLRGRALPAGGAGLRAERRQMRPAAAAGLEDSPRDQHVSGCRVGRGHRGAWGSPCGLTARAGDPRGVFRRGIAIFLPGTRQLSTGGTGKSTVQKRPAIHRDCRPFLVYGALRRPVQNQCVRPFAPRGGDWTRSLRAGGRARARQKTAAAACYCSGPWV